VEGKKEIFAQAQFKQGQSNAESASDYPVHPLTGADNLHIHFTFTLPQSRGACRVRMKETRSVLSGIIRCNIRVKTGL